MRGYAGNIARVDLSRRSVAIEPLGEYRAREFLGGAGLGSRIIAEEVSPTTDPLCEANKIAFMTGPLTATGFPTAGRYEICTKSPLSGTIVDSSSSGHFGIALKQAGLDGVIIEGRSDELVFLVIDEAGVSIERAAHLAGMTTAATQNAVRREVGDDKLQVACIGPAGELGVLMASVVCDGGRAAGRGGTGAVLGSKGIKAIAARGASRVGLAHEASFRNAVSRLRKRISRHPVSQQLREFGTAGTLDTMASLGDVPVRNWAGGLWEEGCHAIGGTAMRDTILKSRGGTCYQCPIRCSRWVNVEGPDYAFEGRGPEYESLAALGALCLNSDLASIAYANHLCDLYGLDTISVGAVIAFAFEAAERGLLGRDLTGALELVWGNPQTTIELIEQIAHRQGLGELLGLGVRRAADQLGEEARSFAIHSKGLEAPMHDPRATVSMALTYATSPRGACHMHGHSALFEWGALLMPEFGIGEPLDWHSAEKKALATILGQDVAGLYNCEVVCIFAGIDLTLQQHAEVINLATDLDVTPKDLMRIGERLSNVQRIYNIAAGLSAEDDYLPDRLRRGTSAAHVSEVPFDEMMIDYYRVRGWDDAGVPGLAKLRELGLAEFASTFGSPLAGGIRQSADDAETGD